MFSDHLFLLKKFKIFVLNLNRVGFLGDHYPPPPPAAPSKKSLYLYSKQQCESCVRALSALFSVFVSLKVIVNENASFTDYASGIQLPDCSKWAINWKNDNDLSIFRHDVLINFFYVVLFLLSCLATGLSFLSISSLVLEL